MAAGEGYSWMGAGVDDRGPKTETDERGAEESKTCSTTPILHSDKLGKQ